MYGQFFESEGYDVALAENAQEATRHLIWKGTQLVLLDIHMPGVNGKTMYEVIREHDPKLKVIVASVYTLEEQKEMITDAQDYHDKSHGNDILLSKVQQVLGSPFRI